LIVPEPNLAENYYRDVYTVSPISLHEAWTDNDTESFIVCVKYKEERPKKLDGSRIVQSTRTL
jgi:hypothetical protein